MTAPTNDPVLNLLDQIGAVMKEVDGAKSAKVKGRDATYQALGLALTLHFTAEESPQAAAQLEALFEKRKIKARAGANPMIRLVKLAFPGRTAVEYNRYAGALAVAVGMGFDEEQFIKELVFEGVIRMSNRARAVFKGETLEAAKQRIEADGLAILDKRKPLAIASWPQDEEVVLLIGVRADDGTLRIHYDPALANPEEALKRVRKLTRHK